MRTPQSSRERVPTVALAGLLTCVLLVGGASRADALGQTIVRACAAAAAAAVVLAGDGGWRRIRDHYRGPSLILAGMAVIAAIQLLPLPPGLWRLLPGRQPYADLAGIAGFAQPWRPLALVPGGALNALFSLSVPAAVLCALANMPRRSLTWLPGAIAGLSLASAFVALLQLSGAGFDNPFINETPGVPSGLLANRNHAALLCAIGVIAVPVWASLVADRAAIRVRGIMAVGAILFLSAMGVVTGSRTGLALLVCALLAAFGLSYRNIRGAVSGWSKRVRLTAGTLAVAAPAGLVWLAVRADRAVSFDRLETLNADDDIRVLALPTIIKLVRTHIVTGSGLGSFDSLFRAAEPFQLLKLTYLNHAHNDYLEIALETGSVGLALLCAAVWWAGRRTVAVWRAPASTERTFGLLGLGILALTLMASVTDYPARTPLIMALCMIAAIILSLGHRTA